MKLEIHDVDGRRFTGDWTGRRRADKPESDLDETDPWLDRAVATAAHTMRERVARLRSVVAPTDATE